MEPYAKELAPLSAGVMIGGRSSRMGRPKALLEVGGVANLDRVVQVVRPFAVRVALIGAGPVTPECHSLDRIDDAADVRGPLAGLLAALRAERGSAWLIAACDMPLVSPAAVAWLVAQRSAGRHAILPIVEGDRVEPLLAIYEPPAAALLEAVAARGGDSPRSIASDAAVFTPAVPPELCGAWTNVNTVEELEGVRRRSRAVE